MYAKVTSDCQFTRCSSSNARNSSGDEIANVNFLYDDIVHVLENTIDTCINSATDRVLQRRFTKFSEITQCNGHYAVQGHSRSPILIPDLHVHILYKLVNSIVASWQPSISQVFQYVCHFAKHETDLFRVIILCSLLFVINLTNTGKQTQRAKNVWMWPLLNKLHDKRWKNLDTFKSVKFSGFLQKKIKI